MSSLTVTPLAPADAQAATHTSSDAVSMLWEAATSAPGAQPQHGTGDKDQPFKPCSAAEWLWIARNKKGTDTYLEIGGRSILWRGNDSYVIDNGAVQGGKVKTLKELAYRAIPAQDKSAHPAAAFIGTSDPSSRFSSDKGGSYPEMYQQLEKDIPNLDNPDVCASVARQVRLLLGGRDSMEEATRCKALPALAATWFLAETGRNPSSFGTSLMLLDMMEARAVYHDPNGAPYRYTWEKTLWHPQVFESERQYFNFLKSHPLAALSPDALHRDPDLARQAHVLDQATALRGAKEAAKDQPAGQILMGFPAAPNTPGGVYVTTRDSRGGDHPMAHMGSVAQSTPGGGGTPTEQQVLTIVRQKEALIVNRWLASCVHAPGAQVQASSALLLAPPGTSKFGKQMFEVPTSGKSRQRIAAFAEEHPVHAAEFKAALLSRVSTLGAIQKPGH